MSKLIVKSHLGNYELHDKKISRSFFLRAKKKTLYLIDKNVYYKNKTINKLKKNIILIKSNENSKSYHKIAHIIKSILKKEIKRDYEICSIGGGIVQDISGFVSSILFRGINWVYIPTTILSQCDSCIGGKTSINFAKYLNVLILKYKQKKKYLF